ncbi:MAG: glycosyltransferase [Thomasclavelia spiroformis]
MKIVQINTVCGIGSTGRIVQDISEILTKKGIENYIYYGQGKSSYKLAKKIGTNLDFRFHQFMSRLTGKHGTYSKKATFKLVKDLEKIQPDVIHLHNIHGFYLNINILFEFFSRYDGKIIWTFHDCWPITGHCAYFDYVSCFKWQNGCSNCPQKKAYPITYLHDNSKQNWITKKNIFTKVKNITICTPSNWLADTVKKSYLSKYPIRVIPNGVDLKLFHPYVRKNENEKPVILAVANIWEERKGLKDIIKIAKVLENEFDFIVIGKQYRSHYSAKNIKFIKQTNNIKELAQYYSMADYFLNTTYEDNFPTTNIEALACGTPVITYDTGGSSESAINKFCLVVEKGNSEKVINFLKENKFKKNSNIVNDCFSCAYLNFNKFNNYNIYINLYYK